MVDLLISIFAFIVAIGILVTFHEWGHFMMAKILGVKVLQFSIGFGKPLIKRRYGQTEYILAALPLGGYVKMLDEREGVVLPEEQPYAFNRQPLWGRFLIVFAGPCANFLFAVLAYWAVYMIGVASPVPVVGEVVSHSIAAQSGMVPGEEIIAIDGMSTQTWSDIYQQLMERVGEEGVLTIQTQVQGEEHHYRLALSKWILKSARPDLLHSLGIVEFRPPVPSIVEDVREWEPAAQAGVMEGDRIIAVNGHPITEWNAFTDVVTNSANIPIHIVIERGKENIELTLTPRARESDTGEVLGFVGLVAKMPEFPKGYMRIQQKGPLMALAEAVDKTGKFIYLTFKVIAKMLVGDIGLGTLSGPISIAQGAGHSMSAGIQYYLSFLALISISLGVLNLLPIPILDGGHLLYYLIEAVTRRPVPDRIQVIGFKIGVFLLIFLMTIAFCNDILRLL